jgi:tRNA-dihydrouridine synthase
LQKSVEWKGEPRGIFEMRRHLSNYFKGLPHFKETRMKLVTSLDVNELLETMEQIAITYADYDDASQGDDFNFFRF